MGGGILTGTHNDDWSNDYYSSGYMSGWLNHINAAVTVAENQIAGGTGYFYTPNALQVARIWRVYLMSELTDNFGPISIDAFQGVNPEFNSVEEVYHFMLQELKEASEALDLNVTIPADLRNLDPAYGYDYGKWQKYANSMRMRLAMRLSEVDPGYAKTEFESAAQAPYISTWDDAFTVEQRAYNSWDDFSPVMSREWNAQPMAATFYNMVVNLGGIESSRQVADSMRPYIRNSNYIGLRYLDHFPTTTNDPKAGYWLDGLPNTIDPRSYVMFPIPGNFSDPNFNFFPSWDASTRTLKRYLTNAAGQPVDSINGKGHYNAHAGGAWGDKGSRNQVRAWNGTIPRVAQRFRDGGERVFFAQWESYFLLAEAAVKGWNAGMSGKAAYERGVDENFAYHNLGSYAAEYLTSTSYNYAGTSASWDHTAEPPATVTKNYVDGYTKRAGTMTFTYPKNDLYKDGSVKNDHLTKIITQKFIAQTPWLPLETWSDHRRLGLPFFENPAVEVPIPNLPALTSSNYMNADIRFFPQRLPYPSSLRAANPEGYERAVSLLGGPDNILTPLWWAIQQ